MDWNKFIIMYKYEEYVRMKDSEEYTQREREEWFESFCKRAKNQEAIHCNIWPDVLNLKFLVVFYISSLVIV